jgi:hypothetical protein
VPKGLKVLKAQQVQLVKSDPQEHKVLKEHKVLRVLRVV